MRGITLHPLNLTTTTKAMHRSSVRVPFLETAKEGALLLGLLKGQLQVKLRNGGALPSASFQTLRPGRVLLLSKVSLMGAEFQTLAGH